MKRNIISISGDPASGKGTVSKILSEKLNYSIYRNGDYFRNLAKEKNMSLEEFSEYVNKHPEIDLAIEDSAREYAKDNDNFIIDARLGWYSVPESFKVYLKVDPNEAAKRAYHDQKRKDVEDYDSINKYKEALEKRFKDENKRYKNLYNIDKADQRNYDLIIDTTNKKPYDVADEILLNYINWHEKSDD